MNCMNCSAPLPPNAVVCEYCGSRNDTDLAGVHTYTTHELESGRMCPHCHVALATIDLKIGGKFFIERCEQCLGLFFDPGELEALLEDSVKHVYAVNLEKLANITHAMAGEDQPVSYIKCPVCSKIMNRVNFGARSGVIVDMCKAHGAWLDSGELRRLLEWKKAGGALLHEQRKIEAAKAKEKLEKQKTTDATVFAQLNKPPEWEGGSLFDQVVSWLFF